MNAMKQLLLLAVTIFLFAACSPQSSLDPATVNDQAKVGSELMKRCQASAQKLAAQCAADAAGCKANAQDVQADCVGAQGTFDTLVQVTTPK